MEPTKRNGRRKAKVGKSGQFITIPFYVLESQAYLDLSHTAVRLLIEIVKQYNGANNGDLTTTMRVLKPRGFNSNDVISKAKNQLIEHGLIQETRKGKRPNVASLYAMTWRSLDMKDKYEISLSAFEKNAFLNYKPP